MTIVDFVHVFLVENQFREVVTYLADCITVVGFFYELYKYLRQARKENDFDRFTDPLPRIVI